MIIQSNETKAQSSLANLLGGNIQTSNIKSNNLFSKLLSTLSEKNEANIVHSTNFKAIIDPKNTTQLKEIQVLLTGSDDKESNLISMELFEHLSNDQVRTLIHKAKEYLKNEITQKAPEYQSDATKLPKSLIGLVQLAQKLGLEPESISLSTLNISADEKNTLPLDILSKPLFETKMLAILPSFIPSSIEATPFEAITQLLSEVKGKDQKNSNKTSSDSSNQLSEQKSASQPLKTLLQSLETRTDSASISQNEAVKSSESKGTTAISSGSNSLITLLQGETDTSNVKTDSTHSKIENDLSKSIKSPKSADSIEVKSKEAAQSMRYFASDLKEAVQEYKPPFTRLTMKLNPEKLGEVEVTLIQRGNNVHVNIQSNNTTTVAFLAHNATELKAQLAHQGITNTTMNFMSGGENQQHNNPQHQHEQRQNTFHSYMSFEELELNEEQLSALEIIIPHYA